MFSIKDACWADLPGTMKKIAEIGYEGIEFFGAFWWSVEEVKKAVEDAGLTVIGWHTPYAAVDKPHIYATIAYAKALGIKYITVPIFPKEMWADAEGWHDCARRLREAAETLEKHGIVMGYHNHTQEFPPVEGEKNAWDIMMGETPQSVTGQLDLGNALAGGGDPLTYLKKYPKRAYTIHLRPYSYKDGAATMIGEDDVDWKGILDEVKAQGVTEWGIVEYSCTAKYPELEGVQRCYDALRALGC